MKKASLLTQLKRKLTGNYPICAACNNFDALSFNCMVPYLARYDYVSGIYERIFIYANDARQRGHCEPIGLYFKPLND